MACPICCEVVTSSKFIGCPKCNMEVCHACVVNFAKSRVGDIRCMNSNCKHIWTRSFLITSLPPSLVYGELKEQRETTLYEKEKALLPMTSKLIPLLQLENELTASVKAQTRILKEIQEKLKNVKEEKNNLIASIEGNNKTKKMENLPRIVCPCPQQDCRGFVFSNDHQCSICSIKICKKCRLVEDDTEHECNPDDVESVKIIQKECKACPGCGAPSRKTEGCSQVWCLVCHKAWDWNTMNIETGYIHATDYFNYMRRNGLNIPERIEPVANCHVNPPIDIIRLARRFPETLTKNEQDFILSRWQIVCENLRQYEPVREKGTMDLRLAYLRKEIDDKKWKRMLHMRDKSESFKKEIQDMLHAYATVMNDMIRECCVITSEKEIKKEVQNIHNLHDIMEQEYYKVAKSFNSKRKSPFIKEIN